MLTPRGEITTNINFVQECDKITVTVTRRNGGEYTGEGTIKGNAIEWTITRNTPSGEITITYTGIVEGDTMSGEATVGDSGTREWTANKK